MSLGQFFKCKLYLKTSVNLTKKFFCGRLSEDFFVTRISGNKSIFSFFFLAWRQKFISRFTHTLIIVPDCFCITYTPALLVSILLLFYLLNIFSYNLDLRENMFSECAKLFMRECMNCLTARKIKCAKINRAKIRGSRNWMGLRYLQLYYRTTYYFTKNELLMYRSSHRRCLQENTCVGVSF